MPEPEFTEEQHEARAPLVEKINELVEKIIHLEKELTSRDPEPEKEQVNDIFDVMRNMSTRTEELLQGQAGLQQALRDQQEIIAGLEGALLDDKIEEQNG